MGQLTRISDCLHFVHVIRVDNGVKGHVEFVQKCDDLVRRTAAG